MAKKYFHDIDFQNVGKILNHPLATNSGDLITKGQMETIVNQLIAGFDFQKDVTGVQKDATLDPTLTPAVGARYIVEDVATLNANFGTILGVENGDIVEYDGTKFVVAFDVSVKGDGVLAFCQADDQYYKYVNGAWMYGGLSAVTAGTALDFADGILNVLFDNITIGVDGEDKLYVKDKSITKAKLGNDIASDGLEQNADGSLKVKAADSTITVTADGIKAGFFIVQKKPFTVGDAAALEFTLNHAIGSTDVQVEVFDIATGATEEAEIQRVDADNVKVIFNIAPALDSKRVVVIG